MRVTWLVVAEPHWVPNPQLARAHTHGHSHMRTYTCTHAHAHRNYACFRDS